MKDKDVVRGFAETKSRIRVAFATAHPDAELVGGWAILLQRGGP